MRHLAKPYMGYARICAWPRPPARRLREGNRPETPLDKGKPENKEWKSRRGITVPRFSNHFAPLLYQALSILEYNCVIEMSAGNRITINVKSVITASPHLIIWA